MAGVDQQELLSPGASRLGGSDTGFPPIADGRADTLILGSMPSRESLRLQQYYGHPRNAFWGIIGRLFGVARDAPYADRSAALLANQLALWDVLESCSRPGSLDSAIRSESIVVNDFKALFERCPAISQVFFNGAKAETEFRRRVLPQLERAQGLALRRLPSSSPAMASLSFDQKLEQWSVLVRNPR